MFSSNSYRLSLVILSVAGLLSACQTLPEAPEVPDTPLNIAREEVPENELLDVGITVFDAGAISEKDRERGVNQDIRNAEARFVAVHLKDSIQRTGHWGAVRVVPMESEAMEVLVRGRIEKSDGESLVVDIDALDATGRKWFSKRYEKRVPQAVYAGAGEGEVFQDIYNRIANDLHREKARLSVEDIEEIHRVAGLRFAGSLAPDAFDGYLKVEGGSYRIARLPAVDDPMFDRVLRIREREYLMVDVVNGYYDNLYAEMSEPYTDWRRLSAEEAAALREVKRKSTNRYLMGSALIIGAIAIEMLGGGDTNTGTLRDVMVIGGASAIKSGADLGAQKKMHKDAIRELGESFQAEVTPMVIDVEGQTTELTGSAEEQFIKWRELLSQIHQSETGLPVPTIQGDGMPESGGMLPPPGTAEDPAVAPGVELPDPGISADIPSDHI